MTLAGWLLLVASCTTITVWMVVCYVRILRAPKPSEEIHTPLDIDTHDV